MTRRPAATLILLAAVNVAAIAVSPLVAEFASRHGEPGWQGWLYPLMTAGLVLASSLFIAWCRFGGGREPWWAWLVLTAAAGFTGWAAVTQAVSR